MTFSYAGVAAICLFYLCVIFSIAYLTEKGKIPERIIVNPITYIFSLGIFASAWSFYGVIDLAHQYGYSALAYYLGTGALFLFAGFALKPLVELAKRFQITSMADMLVFRYNSHLVGGIVTLVMLTAMTPLLALQLQAVADTVNLLTASTQTQASQLSNKRSFALAYCLVLALFALLYVSNRHHHKGLVTAMAAESLIKMSCLLAVGGFVVFNLFDGMQGLDTWLLENPQYQQALRTNPSATTTHALMLVFIATAVSMPHIFHMTVVENKVKQSISMVSWAFPLFLLLMALPIFPILWAGYALELGNSVQYFPLTVPMAADNSTFTIIAFIGGLSAATGAMIAIALSLSTMILNHWILPATRLKAKRDVYDQLVWMRRGLVVAVILIGFVFFSALNNRFNLTQLALPSFIAALQLFPGIIGINHWTRGNRKGFVAGLMVGWLIWLVCLMLPMLFGIERVRIQYIDIVFNVGYEAWEVITILSLGLNTLTFFAVSIFTRQTDEERYSAELCCQDELTHPVRLTLDVHSAEDIVKRLSARIGRATAQAEVDKALQRLNLSANERRPYALRRIRDEIEANLSSLMGASMASEVLDQLVPYRVPEAQAPADINLIEDRLNLVHTHLTGLAAELNNLRMYHRRTLEELPLATCSIGQDMEILMWNSAMERLTGISSDEVKGSRVNDVLEPWGNLLVKFANSSDSKFYKREIQLDNHPHWITLHKANIPSTLGPQVDGQVILLEDVTELQVLEQELVHSERLASVGRLAAGVAHEIGNPITGIDCLAQNLRYETHDPEVLESINQILSQTERVSRIVQSLVSFSHAGQQKAVQFEEVDVHRCVQEAINLLSLQKEKGQVVFNNAVPEGSLVMGDSQRLIQVFINLLSNSRDASPHYGTIDINAETKGNVTRITVTDYGSGIPPENLDRIFEPFFTTKEPGEGTGLGLAMVYSIIEEHHGGIEIESPAHLDTQNGTRFIVTLQRNVARSDSSDNNAS